MPPTGEIVLVTPASIAPGELITLSVSYNAYWAGSFVFPWRTRLSGTLNGYKTENIDVHLRSKTQRVGEPLRFGATMPNHAIKGYITLQKITEISQYLPFGKVVTLDNYALTIHTPPEINPITPKIPPKAGIFPAIPTTLPKLPEIPGLPSPEGTTLGIKNKYLMYAGIGIAIAALLYFLVFRKKGRKK